MKKGKARWKRICVMGTIGILAFILTGCGAMFSGSSTNVSLKSQPEGVNVEIQPTGEKAITPTSVKLKNSQTYTIIARKDGYKQQTQTLDKKIKTDALVCDILWFLPGIIPGAIAIGIDLGGGLYELDKNYVEFVMEPEKVSTPAPSSENKSAQPGS